MQALAVGLAVGEGVLRGNEIDTDSNTLTVLGTRGVGFND